MHERYVVNVKGVELDRARDALEVAGIPWLASAGGYWVGQQAPDELEPRTLRAVVLAESVEGAKEQVAKLLPKGNTAHAAARLEDPAELRRFLNESDA